MSPRQSFALRLATTLFCFSGILITSPAQAVFFNPPGNQIPSSIGGNSRRGGCAVDEVETEVEALVAPVEAEQTVAFLPIVPNPSRVVALTTQASTPLWVYVPPTRAQSAEFSLFDNVTNRFVYSGRFAIETTGIYQINLPDRLELNVDQPTAPQDYTWFIDLVCEPNNPAANLSHTGTLKRVAPNSLSPDFESSLDQAVDPLDRANVYGNYGLWLDLVAAVVEKRETMALADVMRLIRPGTVC
ncbi:MAG: DUF928 domain-containing protein [Coleofasciculaceae cyanobacterium RL_1_1]|nr:DUF928 domain-containing protein [Coleofasciculaceae cyanobacterium RL_1_1]